MNIDNSITIGRASIPQADNREDLKLKNACREFESLLVAHMLNQMRSTVPKGDLFGDSSKEEIFQGMLDQEIAKEISQTDALNIGKILYMQLSSANKNG